MLTEMNKGDKKKKRKVGRLLPVTKPNVRYRSKRDYDRKKRKKETEREKEQK